MENNNEVRLIGFFTPEYCTQNKGACDICSLSSYGRDCKNNKIITADQADQIDNKINEQTAGLESSRQAADRHRKTIKKYINDLPLSDYQKGKIIGWGHNYKKRMSQNISDEELIKAVEKLAEYGK